MKKYCSQTYKSFDNHLLFIEKLQNYVTSLKCKQLATFQFKIDNKWTIELNNLYIFKLEECGINNIQEIMNDMNFINLFNNFRFVTRQQIYDELNRKLQEYIEMNQI